MAVNATTLNKVLNKIGSSYQIRLGSTSFNLYGDEEISWNTFTNTGYVQVMSDNDQIVQAGLMNVGDAKGYFRSDSNIVPGSLIQVMHQGKWYEGAGDPILYHMSGNSLIKEVNLKKIIN